MHGLNLIFVFLKHPIIIALLQVNNFTTCNFLIHPRLPNNDSIFLTLINIWSLWWLLRNSESSTSDCEIFSCCSCTIILNRDDIDVDLGLVINYRSWCPTQMVVVMMHVDQWSFVLLIWIVYVLNSCSFCKYLLRILAVSAQVAILVLQWCLSFKIRRFSTIVRLLKLNMIFKCCHQSYFII